MFNCARTGVGDRNSAKIPGLCSSLPTYLYRQPFIERTERHEKSWESAGEGIITPAKVHSFVDFLRRIRAGDDAAAHYENPTLGTKRESVGVVAQSLVRRHQTR